MGKFGDTEKKRLSGGAWRRFFAMCIDFVLILSVYQAVGVYLYQSTGGQWRMDSTPIGGSTCQSDDGLKGRNQTLPALMADRTTTCTYWFFGYEYNRTKKISHVVEHSVKNGVSYTRTNDETYYVDAHDNRVDNVFLIDGLKGLTLLTGLALFEGLLATTPGKLLMGLKLINGRAMQPGILQTLWRNFLIWGAWTVNGAYMMFAPWLSAHGIDLFPNMIVLYSWLAVFAIWYLAPALSFLFARPNPFYDIWSGVYVVPMKQLAHEPNVKLVNFV